MPPDSDHVTLDGNGSLVLPQDKSSGLSPTREALSVNSDFADDVINSIDFNKLLQPSSSDYYYSNANLSNRQLLEKMKSKKSVSNGHKPLLPQARASLLRKRLEASSYRGPEPRHEDGSPLKSAMKKTSRRKKSACLTSTDSLASQEEGNHSNTPMVRRCVFSCVDIREHERIAGDNPCVTKGVPLSIGWGYYQHSSIELEEYEFNRGPPRDKIEMMVPPSIRHQILRDEFGVSTADINASIKEANITKKQRKSTLGTEPLEGWLEAAESTKRKFKRFVKGTSTAKEEEKIWARAQQNALNERPTAADKAESRG